MAVTLRDFMTTEDVLTIPADTTLGQAARLMRALEETCHEGPRTRDVGGSATTREVGGNPADGSG